MNWSDSDSGTERKISLIERLIKSPTIVFSLSLVLVYLFVGAVAGDFVNPIDSSPDWVLLLLAQCNPCILLQSVNGLPLPWTPWTLVTSVFLHAGILHLLSNLFFLLIFGYILEEQLDNWITWGTIFLVTGIAGNLSFLAAYAAFGPGVGIFGVGASGAVYGILGAAAGFKIAILLILVAGLDIFAGGGFFAHIGGLITGMILRRYWLAKAPIDM